MIKKAMSSKTNVNASTPSRIFFKEIVLESIKTLGFPIIFKTLLVETWNFMMYFLLVLINY